MILRYDKALAKSLLEGYYLGIYASPDTKGYEMEIEVMLDDYAEIFGQEDLQQYLLTDTVSIRRLKDHKIIRSLSDAMNMAEDEVLFWINSNKVVSKEEMEYLKYNDLSLYNEVIENTN